MCQLRPHLKTDEEIMAAFKKEMAEDLDAIRKVEVYDDTDTIKSLTDEDSAKIDYSKTVEVNPASLRLNEPAIAKALEIENRIRRYYNEAAFIIDGDGNVIFENLLGEKNSVDISKSAIKNNTVTHNHSTGGTFSDKDVAVFALYDAQEFRACTPSEINFSIRRGDGSIDKTIAVDYYDEMTRIREDAYVYARKNSETEAEYEILYTKIVSERSHNWLVGNAKNYGYIYTLEDKEK